MYAPPRQLMIAGDEGAGQPSGLALHVPGLIPGIAWALRKRGGLMVQKIDEKQAVEHVYQRLTARFPGVDPATVRLAVEEALSSLDGPVRNYVPVLVERAARERLTSI